MATSTSHRSERRGIRRLLHWAVLGLAAMAALGVVVGSAMFRVRAIQIAGASHLRESRLAHLSGVVEGQSSLLLRPVDVVRRLEANPWVASATVRRELPSTVFIAIVERSPVAVVRRGGVLEMLAADGTALGSSRGSALPEVTSAPGGGANPGVAAMGAMPLSLREQVRRASIAADGSITLALDSGIHVDYGDPAQLAAKARALRSVLDWARNNRVRLSTIDVRSPSSPSAKPSSPAGNFAVPQA